MTKNVNEEEINDFIQNNEEKEIRQIIQVSKNKTHFTWDDFDGSISPYTWGNAIQKRILEPQNSRQYEMQNRKYIEEKLSNNSNTNTNESIDEDIDANKSKDNVKETKDDNVKETKDDNVKETKDDNVKETKDDNVKENDTKEEELPEVNPKEANWTKYDKGLALITFGSILGFSFEFIRNIIYSVLNAPLSILVDLMPFYLVVLILAFITSAWSMYAREIYLDTDTKDYKKHINAMKAEDSFFQVAEDATAKEEDEFMRIQQAMVKTKSKPFVWTLGITIPILVWMYTITSIVGIGQTITFPIFGETTYSGFVFLVFQAYIFWYIVCSVISSQIMKRVFILLNHSK